MIVSADGRLAPSNGAKTSGRGKGYNDHDHPVRAYGHPMNSREEKAMTKQLPKTDTSAVNVADYIVERLAAEGIDHCFGVAGDYSNLRCGRQQR